MVVSIFGSKDHFLDTIEEPDDNLNHTHDAHTYEQTKCTT